MLVPREFIFCSLPKSSDPVRYIVLQLGLAGPILQVSRTVFNEVCRHSPLVVCRSDRCLVRRIVTEKLREAFADMPDQRRLADPVSSTPSGNGANRRRGDLLAEKMLEM